ncbi:uncharacterized protein LOC132622886 [Lycium barbarum]|uniref:uncharacterized protein LOC132622886 n=1 Tax=Lycium barbarum TaxID=112863 RepID=UPI00293E9BE6|nr:uncharacterized protein LOC132622886 [Lycium barbarum]
MKLETSIEQSPNVGNSRRRDDGDFNLREWSLKAKISREKTNSRRFSASYITSFRDVKSFRSNISISSTASSPGYTLREEIEPSTYSFTNALKALQAKTIYSWEYMSPDGLALNSKWNEAEKYICNPLSGEVPLECLSAKTLSARSFRQLTSKITMSAPLIYPSQIQTRQFPSKPPTKVVPHLPKHQLEIQIPNKEKRSVTRDVGTQSSTPANYLSSKSPSPARTPSIDDRSTKRCVADADDSPMSMTTPASKSEEQVEVKETRRKEDTKINEDEQLEERNNNYKVMQQSSTNSSKCRQGCLSWRSLCMRQKQQRERKHSKSIKKKKNIFLCYINGC